MSFSKWIDILSQIKASPRDINMYPFSQAFISMTNTIHIRQLTQSELAVNL